jgi:hypothetical protein
MLVDFIAPALIRFASIIIVDTLEMESISSYQ